MKTWQSILLVIAVIGALCFASLFIGFTIGRSVTELKFNAPQRDLGRALAELRTEIQNKNYQIVEQRINYLETNWYSIDFFREKVSPPRIAWHQFIYDYEKIDKQNKE